MEAKHLQKQYVEKCKRSSKTQEEDNVEEAATIAQGGDIGLLKTLLTAYLPTVEVSLVVTFCSRFSLLLRVLNVVGKSVMLENMEVMAEDGSHELVAEQVKVGYQLAQKDVKAGRRYEESLMVKPDFYEGYLALGLQLQ
ncbi:hypothetical protein Tco_0228235 [Tanacetum coccineum]